MKSGFKSIWRAERGTAGGGWSEAIFTLKSYFSEMFGGRCEAIWNISIRSMKFPIGEAGLILRILPGFRGM